jgi:uncharacterized membrane protein
MKNLLARTVGTVPLFATGVSLAQSGHMMDDGSWGVGWMGGFGGIWVPIFLVIVAVGLLVWVVQRKSK